MNLTGVEASFTVVCPCWDLLLAVILAVALLEVDAVG